MPQYVVQQQGLDSIVVMAGEGQVVLYVGTWYICIITVGRGRRRRVFSGGGRR